VRDRMVIFGGDSGFYNVNDVWALSLAGMPAWTQLTPSGTPPDGRSFHSAIYDPVRDRMIVFGGRNGNDLRDLWALSFSGAPEWTRLLPTGALPAPRWGQSAIYDPLRDRMVIFAGAGYVGALNDVWALSLSGMPAWTALMPTGVPPGVRYGISAIYDPVRDQMVTFGGYTYTGTGNDTWTLSLSGTPAWTMLIPAGPTPAVRYGYDEIYDPYRDRIVIFGGSGALLYDDVWELPLSDPHAWLPLAPSGPPPGARYGPSAIYDPIRGHMVIFGGGGGPYSRFNDAWVLSPGDVLDVGGPEARPPISDLRPPSPNPSRGTTTLSYSTARMGWVRLSVYDAGGRLLRRLVDAGKPAGTETVIWDGTDESGSRVRTGLYFVLLTGPAICETRKVVLLR
jgi:hypothetical protein